MGAAKEPLHRQTRHSTASAKRFPGESRFRAMLAEAQLPWVMVQPPFSFLVAE